MSGVAGPFESMTLKGITLSIHADSSPTIMNKKYNNEAIDTTGDTIRKQVPITPQITGNDVVVDALLDEQLSALNDQKGIFTISLKNANGDTYRAIGFINYQGYQPDSKKATIDLFSAKKAGFVLFKA